MIFIFKQKQNITLKVYQILNQIYGLGKTKIKNLIIKLGINYKTTLFNLKKFRALKLNKKLLIMDKFYFFNILKNREVNTHYKRVQIGCYKGIKLVLGLPLNGQRTHTNAQTFKRLNRNKGLMAIVKSKILYDRKKLKNKKKWLEQTLKEEK